MRALWILLAVALITGCEELGEGDRGDVVVSGDVDGDVVVYVDSEYNPVLTVTNNARANPPRVVTVVLNGGAGDASTAH